MMIAATTNEATASVSGAVSTTTNVLAGTGPCLNGAPAFPNPDPTNCNLYTDPGDVWLSGLPDSATPANGTYFFAVLARLLTSE